MLSSSMNVLPLQIGIINRLQFLSKLPSNFDPVDDFFFLHDRPAQRYPVRICDCDNAC